MIALVSILHDPDARLIELMRNNLGKIRFLFGTFTVVVTENTHPMVISLLKHMNIVIKFDSGELYEAYKNALQEGAKTSADTILMIDFDRLLVWAERFFDELTKLKELDGIDYIIIERSESALRSHPQHQFETESLVNYFLSKEMGFNEERDFFSGAWMFSKEVVWYIIENMKSKDKGFYSEWHLLAKEKAKSMNHIKCKGLEWETYYQYKDEVDEVGLAVWQKQFNEKDKNKRFLAMYEMLKIIKERS